MKEFARTNLVARGQEALKPLFSMGNYVKNGRIEKTLQELIKLRVSQINGEQDTKNVFSTDVND